MTQRDFETRFGPRGFTRILKNGAPPGFELLFVSKAVRAEFMSIGVNKILLECSTFTHGSFSSVCKALPETICRFLRGIQHSIFEFDSMIDYFEFCHKSATIQPQLKRTLELHLIVDGIIWDGMAEEQWLEYRDGPYYESESDVDSDLERPEPEKLNKYDLERTEAWACRVPEQREIWYDDALPLRIKYDIFERMAGLIVGAIEHGRISKYIIRFRYLNWMQKYIIQIIEAYYQAYVRTAGLTGLAFTIGWEDEPHQLYREYRYGGSMSFEKVSD